MKIPQFINTIIKKLKKRLEDFFYDENAGNLVEYALLIGFGLFLFFILVGIMVSMMDWTAGQSNEFFDVVEGLND